MEITKEQLRQLLKNNEEGNDQLVSADLRSWFPDAFTKLKVGRWYKVNRRHQLEQDALVLFKGDGVKTFGFDHIGDWTDDYGSENTFCDPRYDYTEATHEEVETALIEEAVRRGYKNGNHDCLVIYTHKNTDEVFYLYKDTMDLHIGKNGPSNIVFKDGEWAETFKQENNMIEVFNVLYKGVEINVTPFCLAFLREDDARSWIEQTCETKNFTIKSTLGWNDAETVDDYRVEDRDGNSYYFVIFKQQL